MTKPEVLLKFDTEDSSLVVVVIVVVDGLVHVVDPRNLPLKFSQNRIRSSWDIDDVEFPMVGGGWWWKVIFVSNPTFVMIGWFNLWLSLGWYKSCKKSLNKNCEHQLLNKFKIKVLNKSCIQRIAKSNCQQLLKRLLAQK